MAYAHTKYTHIGFLTLNGRPPLDDPEQYHDFLGKTWNPQELNLALDLGVLTEGTILQGEKDTVVVINLENQVAPRQTLVNISKVINIKPERRTVQVKPVCPGCGMTFDLTPTIDWVHHQNLQNIQGVM